ncbi:DUF501 domain-containing protein [Bifidobacterium vansinderenii]|uniref:Septum formation initiator family protein n=1 Tax=Bifidobacterium vansinderenii TaxID=1984871 RepID=A0A229VUP8_9BIFI|nr:DUF501 domain-containing protein [Bifidobacterium vansinderenii]OXM99343.1 hypothetical protein Tam10B_2365 [Bifidobacterium vansinderenii]
MNNDDIRKVTAILQDRLGEGLDQRDIDVVQRQLGRFPRGMVAVGARCVCGNPLAVITRPLVEGRIPFPTACYLTSPEAVKAVSRLEADGDMVEYTRQVQDDPDTKAAYERAHEMYLEFRHQLAERLGDDESHIEGISAGGMPVRVKCLHALTGQALVMGEGVNPVADDVLRRVKAQFDPNVCRCAVPYGAAEGENDGKDDAR